MEEEAVRIADDIVRMTQPSGRDTDLSPLFKRGSELQKILLQFQTSLNVIWQNIRYDMPAAFAEGNVLQGVGIITGYVLAGVSMGLLTEGLGGDDDDEKKKVAAWRQLVYFSFTQASDSVPLLGNDLTNLWSTIMTGRRQYTGTNFFPVITEAASTLNYSMKGAEKLSEGDYEAMRKNWFKALGKLEAGFAYSFGLPQSGLKELGRAAGIGDGDGELGFNWQAFMGRR
jgi:hypothetical protein